jgi:MoxR-like ATPase
LQEVIEEELNRAVNAAIGYAMEEGQYGILVTRDASTTFTVTLTANIPYGQILKENGVALMYTPH